MTLRSFLYTTLTEDWPEYGNALDDIWKKSVMGEASFMSQEGECPKLRRDPALLCKPYSSLNAVIAVLGSYPTLLTTSQARFGIVRDMSNPCMFTLFHKLGFEEANIQRNTVMIIDVFPRRLNRGDFASTPSRASSLFKKLPKDLVSYWETQALNLYKQCPRPLWSLWVVMPRWYTSGGSTQGN
jgi:hypothetical protein